ncbi:TRAP transporter small permease [Frigidibacter sp. MR17.24]|uniref:TRAP transporter small permease n=1 Tax=Frigidibacter sp. MR17.24 TaxID=3127345 RepID=UPI003012F2D6
MTSAADPVRSRAAGTPPPRAEARPAERRRGSLWTRFEFRWLLGLSTLLAVAATLIMLVEAFSRGFLDHSYFWAEESVRYLMIWAFFLTLGAAGRGGFHIRTEMLVDMLPQHLRRVCHLLASLAGIAFAVILFAASIPQITRYYTMGMMTESTLDLPMWALFLAMPIGSTLLGIYYLGCLMRAWHGEEPFGAQPGAGGLDPLPFDPEHARHLAPGEEMK